ncbi:MAG: DNA translocase FtsK 4TM domain-containing protein, partial [bacterium]
MAKVKFHERGPHAFWHEVAAIFILAFSMLLLLALVSFKASDLGFLHTPVSANKDNWVGIGGAYAAGTLFLTFGLAAYFFPIILLGTAVLLVFKPFFHTGSKVGWTLLMVVSGAVLFQLAQPIFGKALFNPIQSELSQTSMLGGLVGYWLNDKVFAKLLGNVGAAVIMGVTHIASFIFLFEIRPRDIVLGGWQMVSKWQREREAVKLESADPEERIIYQKRALEREHRQLLKKLAKESTEEIEKEEEEPVERPEPKVIDTTVAPPKEKPSKAETPAVSKRPVVEALP